jgi:hypothetical protein
VVIVAPAADHLWLLREAIEALPPALRAAAVGDLDGAGASHELVKDLDRPTISWQMCGGRPFCSALCRSGISSAVPGS